MSEREQNFKVEYSALDEPISEIKQAVHDAETTILELYSDLHEVAQDLEVQFDLQHLDPHSKENIKSFRSRLKEIERFINEYSVKKKNLETILNDLKKEKDILTTVLLKHESELKH